LSEAAYRGGPKSDQDIAWVGRVALEITAKDASDLCSRQEVSRERIVIEPNSLKAGP
jgi:hypothetical protein